MICGGMRSDRIVAENTVERSKNEFDKMNEHRGPWKKMPEGTLFYITRDYKK
jgi:hypothetical protein